MKNKTYRFATALAVLLALALVFVAPVGAYSGTGQGTEGDPYIALSFLLVGHNSYGNIISTATIISFIN